MLNTPSSVFVRMPRTYSYLLLFATKIGEKCGLTRLYRELFRSGRDKENKY